jgi:hypothetical protein
LKYKTWRKYISFQIHNNFYFYKKFILFTFQFLGERDERETYCKMTEERKVIGCCDFDNKNSQYWCQRVLFDEFFFDDGDFLF